MNKTQLKELFLLHEEGIGEDVLDRLLNIDECGLIKPHFQMRPVLFMIMDHTPVNEKWYKEYENEYGDVI